MPVVCGSVSSSSLLTCPVEPSYSCIELSLNGFILYRLSHHFYAYYRKKGAKKYTNKQICRISPEYLNCHLVPNQCFCSKDVPIFNHWIAFQSPFASSILDARLARAKDTRVNALTNKNLRNLDRLSK